MKYLYYTSVLSSSGDIAFVFYLSRICFVIWKYRYNIRGGIQNIPDRCRHLHNSCGSAKHRYKQAKLWIPGSTATFCRECVKTCEDVAPNFSENRSGCFTMTAPVSHFHPHPAVYGEIEMPVIPHLPYSSDLTQSNFFLNSKMKLKLKGRRFDTTQNHSECLTLWQKRTSNKRSKNGGDGGICVYMRKGTTSRVMAADRPYEEFYDFYSVSPEYCR
jgi:hypothetical protein